MSSSECVQEWRNHDASGQCVPGWWSSPAEAGISISQDIQHVPALGLMPLEGLREGKTPALPGIPFTCPGIKCCYPVLLSSVVDPLGSWCPERGESSACLLMQWVTPRPWGGCELQCHPRVTPSMAAILGCHLCDETAQGTSVVCLILSSRTSHASSSLVIRRNMTFLRLGPQEGQQEQSAASSWAVPLNTAWHLVWPSVLLSMSIMERSDTPENFLRPDCKDRVKVGHFLCYFRAHSLLLKHIM